MHMSDTAVACDMLADDATLHTSGKDILQIEHVLRDSLDQISNCDNKSMERKPTL